MGSVTLRQSSTFVQELLKIPSYSALCRTTGSHLDRPETCRTRVALWRHYLSSLPDELIVAPQGRRRRDVCTSSDPAFRNASFVVRQQIAMSRTGFEFHRQRELCRRSRRATKATATTKTTAPRMATVVAPRPRPPRWRGMPSQSATDAPSGRVNTYANQK
jgi:hypothetical protein